MRFATPRCCYTRWVQPARTRAADPRRRWTTLALAPAVAVLAATAAGLLPLRAGFVTGCLLALAGAARTLATWRANARLEREADEELVRLYGRAVPALVAWRAAELLQPAERKRLARSLHKGVEERVRGGRSAAVPFDRQAVEENLALLRRLAGALADLSRPVRPGGVVLVRRLLVDGGSPLYAGARRHELRPVLQEAVAALELPPGPDALRLAA
jgi:hypothetical protein